MLRNGCGAGLYYPSDLNVPWARNPLDFERGIIVALRCNTRAKFIHDSIGDLAERCKKLYAAKGGLFEEGGRKKRRRPL